MSDFAGLFQGKPVTEGEAARLLRLQAEWQSVSTADIWSKGYFPSEVVPFDLPAGSCYSPPPGQITFVSYGAHCAYCQSKSSTMTGRCEHCGAPLL